ncbi:MAG: lactate racemase domain-containing protein [Candidatus Thorarchaeota archaeon]|nr:lactate racemase domain-containing protein [Candidatus Thorarchaeota archaeon]
MRYEIEYGDGVLPIEISRLYMLEHTLPKTVVESPHLESHFFQDAESSGFLRSIADGDRRDSNIAIVLDNPFQCPNSKKILDSLMDLLEPLGTPLSNITLILAIPKHLRSNLDPLMSYLGNPGHRDCVVQVHDEKRESSLRHLGDSHTRSIPVYMNSRYTDATHRILLSSVRPSIFTGVTGGAASISSGICGQKTLHKFHRIVALNETGLFNVDGVVAETMNEITTLCPPDLAITTTHDNSGTLARIAVGDLQTSWASAIKDAQSITAARVQRRADIAIVGAGGRGFDGTLYDALESLHAGFTVTRTGGTILLIAECSYGPGPDGFVETVSLSESEQDVITHAETAFENGMERSRFFMKVLESRNLVICSRMRESLVTEKLHCVGVRDPQEGLDIATTKLGSHSKVTLVQNGSNINPVMD